MRLATVHVFKFTELSGKAQEKAIENYRATQEYPWTDENLDSAKAFAEWFGLSILDYNLGSCNSFVKFKFKDPYSRCAELRGVRLWKYLQNQVMLPDLSGACPFTGYCFDEVLLDELRKFLERPYDCFGAELMRYCFDSFAQAYSNDVDHFFSSAAIAEQLTETEAEFTADGSEWSP